MININFDKIIIHHFLSFNHAEIILANKGYCLVSGINNNPLDAAKSNGAGKSTIFNAISFALVGETLQGLKSNLANNYYNDGCYVELDFTIDNNKYKLIRSKDDKNFGTNLKVFVNGEDKSGKGIRESQAVLSQLLPDLTSELIGSVIILGQGLPQKFTSNTPSGRKEVLEHLSKSDFMIQDLKDRLEARLTELSTTLRTIEDTVIKLNSEETLYSNELNETKDKLTSFNTTRNFVEELTTKQAELNTAKVSENTYKEKLAEVTSKEVELTNKINEQSTIKNDRLTEVYKKYLEYDNELSKMKWDFQNQVRTFEEEIKAMKEIKDICPTCGQRIPNVIKPDTTQKEADLICVKNSLNNTIQDIEDNNKEYQKVCDTINLRFKEATDDLNRELNDITTIKVNDITPKLTATTTLINKLNIEIVALEKDRDSYEQKLKEYKDKISSLESKLSNINITKAENKDKETKINKHLDIISKMNTLIKRDFRGILLQDIITFINNKMKEYAAKIFDTDQIEMQLAGNDIDIKFCNKDYENLSGGEKQRVDLIVQFAIRNMLSNYLGFTSNILVLDEITDALDSTSCDRVINFITQELSDIESIFIISHHAASLSIPYDTELTVVKDNLGVSEVQ